MAQGKKISTQDKSRVIIEKVNNPDLSTRDIEKITGVDHSTVSNIINKDLQQLSTESERIIRIIDNDLESIENMSEITKRFTKELKLKEALGRADITVANTTTESAFKRSQIFQNKPTDINKLSFEGLSDMSTDKLSETVMGQLK